jgi:hypothetical protein
VRLTTTGAKTGIHIPSPTALKLWGENFSNSKLVAPTGFEPVFRRGHVFAKYINSFGRPRPRLKPRD